ncbi:hypothetical protein ACFL96_11230 [Thermoproteota archaeon]
MSDDGLFYNPKKGILEIITPAVPINKGFATRLTDLLTIGTNTLLEAVPELEFTGLCFDWNLTKGNEEYLSFLEGLALPFNLFGLNPLSEGLIFTPKDYGNRNEITGDYLRNPRQTMATALLLGAYSYAIDKEGKPPFSLKEFYGDQNHTENLYFDQNYKDECPASLKNILPQGRYSRLKIEMDNGFKGYVQAQQALEMFYQWITPYVMELGTEREISNLNSFVYGKKLLDADRFKYFAHLQENKGIKDGVFIPMSDSNLKSKGEIITKSKSGELPPEGKVFGYFVKHGKGWGIDLDLNHVRSIVKHPNSPPPFSIPHLVGPEEIYEFTNELDAELPIVGPSVDLTHVTIGETLDPKGIPAILYDLSTEDFEHKLITGPKMGKTGGRIWNLLKRQNILLLQDHIDGVIKEHLSSEFDWKSHLDIYPRGVGESAGSYIQSVICAMFEAGLESDYIPKMYSKIDFNSQDIKERFKDSQQFVLHYSKGFYFTLADYDKSEKGRLMYAQDIISRSLDYLDQNNCRISMDNADLARGERIPGTGTKFTATLYLLAEHYGRLIGMEDKEIASRTRLGDALLTT